MPENEERYSCQLRLPDFGKTGQQGLQQAKVLIVGMGGLGCPTAMYLAAAGVGTLGIADHDIISTSNLHRQVLYTAQETGQKKVVVARQKLQAQNPAINIVAYDERVTAANVVELLAAYDIIVDATDNFETHYLLNDACVMAGKPLVHGAIYQYEGHVAVWNMKNADGSYSPNYRDVFPEVDPFQVPDCSDGGVLPTIAGIIGCMQANEVIKIAAGLDGTLTERMLILDARNMQCNIINIGTTTKTNITGLSNNTAVQAISYENAEKIRNNGDAILVDVRTKEEHIHFNIGGVNIPLDLLEHHLQEFENKTQVVFYCASGKRSMQAAQWLKGKSANLTVLSIEGGINSLQIPHG